MTCTGCGGSAGWGRTDYSVCNDCRRKSDREQKARIRSLEQSNPDRELTNEEAFGIFRFLLAIGTGILCALVCALLGWLNDSTGRILTLVCSGVGIAIGSTKIFGKLIGGLLGVLVLYWIGAAVYGWIKG
jgi:hypothetical protein